MRARGGPGSPPHEGQASTAGGDMQFQPTCLSDNLRRTILSDSFLKGIRFHPLPLPAALHVEREARRHPRPELRTGCGRREASGRKGVGEFLAGFLAFTCHSVSRRKHLQRLDDAKKPIEPFSSGPRRPRWAIQSYAASASTAALSVKWTRYFTPCRQTGAPDGCLLDHLLAAPSSAYVSTSNMILSVAETLQRTV